MLDCASKCWDESKSFHNMEIALNFNKDKNILEAVFKTYNRCYFEIIMLKTYFDNS